ncbi:MAG: tetratricopeptide repeat protein [Planctomycetes bacterium]|nr:tetratricopeptide repeat protein [Planctomycetota bacterium]
MKIAKKRTIDGRTSGFVAALLLAAAGAGCAGRSPRPYQTPESVKQRHALDARQLNEAGLRFVEKGDWENAERRFREALEQDLYCVAAHNNLGLVLLRTRRHYEAAWEFEYATKLVPSAGEPRANLGLLYENIGRLDRAAEAYEEALELDPGNLATMRHLARTYVKADRHDDRVKQLLERLLGTTDVEPAWDYWVRGQLIRVGRDETRGDGPS